MTPHRKKCPHVVHFNVPRDWFETNSRHQKRYSEGGQKIRGCRGLLGGVIPRQKFFIFLDLKLVQVYKKINLWDDEILTLSLT